MNKIEITTVEAFHEALAAHDCVLVDFYKDNCPGCKMLDMSLMRFATTPAAEDVTLLKVKMENVGEAFFHEQKLRQTPTLIMYRAGEEMGRQPGFAQPAQIEALVAQPA